MDEKRKYSTAFDTAIVVSLVNSFYKYFINMPDGESKNEEEEVDIELEE